MRFKPQKRYKTISGLKIGITRECDLIRKTGYGFLHIVKRIIEHPEIETISYADGRDNYDITNIRHYPGEGVLIAGLGYCFGFSEFIPYTLLPAISDIINRMKLPINWYCTIEDINYQEMYGNE